MSTEPTTRVKSAEELAEEALEKKAATLAILLAVMAGLAGIQSGNFANNALAEKGLAGQKLTQSADHWAYFQADSVKGTVWKAQARMLQEMKLSPGAVKEFQDQVGHYEKKKAANETEARARQAEADKLNKQSDDDFSANNSMDYSSGFAQIAIAIISLVVLTHQVRLLYLGSALGLISVFLLINGFYLWIRF